jgi:subtilisin-like proprotein convertase family protein
MTGEFRVYVVSTAVTYGGGLLHTSACRCRSAIQWRYPTVLSAPKSTLLEWSCFMKFANLTLALGAALAAPLTFSATAHAAQDVVTTGYNDRSTPWSVLSSSTLPYFDRATRFAESPAVRALASAGAPASIARNAQIALATPAPDITFDGISADVHQALFGRRPYWGDVHGDVGPNHYVGAASGPIGIYNKSTGALMTPPFALNSLFQYLEEDHPCRVVRNDDQMIVYDNLADRWVLNQLAYLDHEIFSRQYLCMAVSRSADPAGTYFTYVYELPPIPSRSHFLRLGVWNDAYYATTLQGSFAAIPTPTGEGSGIFAFDRARILRGQADAGFIYFNRPTPGEGGIIPSDVEGLRPPPAGNSQVLMRFTASEFGAGFADAIVPYTFSPNFDAPGASTLTVGTAIAVAPFDGRRPLIAGDIERTGPGSAALNDVAQSSVAYNNLGTQAAPVHAHAITWGVNVSGAFPGDLGYNQFASAIRWTELRRDVAGNLSIRDQGTLADTDTNGVSGPDYMTPHIAQDRLGNLAVGFVAIPPGLALPEIRWAGRTGAATTGTLNQGQALMFRGTGSAYDSHSKFSTMKLDPADSCTFFYQNAYRVAAHNGESGYWNSRIGRFKFPECTTIAPAQLSVNVSACATGTPIAGAQVQVGGGYLATTNASGVAQFSIVADTYTVTAKVAGATSTSPIVALTPGSSTIADVCLSGAAAVVADGSQVIGESFTPFNQAVDPAESVNVSLCVANSGYSAVGNLIGTLSSSGGVLAPSGPQTYGAMPARSTALCRPFSFSVNPALTCGDNVTATLQLADGSTPMGSVSFVLRTGVFVSGGQQTIAYTGPPVAIPDNVPAGVSAPINVAVGGRVTDVELSFDAQRYPLCSDPALEHTFLGDLEFRLVSPAGLSQALLIQRGNVRDDICGTVLDDDGLVAAAQIRTDSNGARLFGRFRPEVPFSIFDGQAADGVWTLKVADIAPNDDGVLKRFSLNITNEIRSCGSAGNPQLFLSGFE